MDNILQINEIRKYHAHLCVVSGIELNQEIVATIWIRKYAHLWRVLHPVSQPGKSGTKATAINVSNSISQSEKH